MSTTRAVEVEASRSVKEYLTESELSKMGAYVRGEEKVVEELQDD